MNRNEIPVATYVPFERSRFDYEPSDTSSEPSNTHSRYDMLSDYTRDISEHSQTSSQSSIEFRDRAPTPSRTLSPTTDVNMNSSQILDFQQSVPQVQRDEKWFRYSIALNGTFNFL